MLFDPKILKNLWKPEFDSNKNDNGQLTIVAGSKLFHGPAFFTTKVASRFVDMVFLASPEPSIGKVANIVKSKLSSFIWVPWEDVKGYLAKSDACLIGPGFMRFGSKKDEYLQKRDYCDQYCQETREITRDLLTSFPDKKWVIDGGSLQVMDTSWIPENSILTPNTKEYKLLFGDTDPSLASKKFKCFLVLKGPITKVYSPDGKVVEVPGGNPGLTKGGTGDVQAGITAALLTKNDPKTSAIVGAYAVKKAADNLYSKVGFNYNSDDLANEIPQVLR